MERPNRSDIHLSKEEEETIEEETREYFDELAPKRHSKPQRSEHSSHYVDANTRSDIIPELAEFQRLENDPQKLDYNNGNQAAEEFVETDYYKDLNCVDKQHHTTGTGFITMEDNGNAIGKNYSIEPDLGIIHHDSCKGNPATNEWIPSGDNEF
uniref:Maternal effect embryo arrest 59 n=1 Tax=Opuntia streptacantha TaxID=393608 RepID=A0A7C9D906_OPUST